MKRIVGVKFEDKYHPGEYRGTEYSYREETDLDLKVGDIVMVPTKHGEGQAKVTRVNIPESQVDERYLKDLKIITSRAGIAPSTESGQLAL